MIDVVASISYVIDYYSIMMTKVINPSIVYMSTIIKTCWVPSIINLTFLLNKKYIANIYFILIDNYNYKGSECSIISSSKIVKTNST